MTQGGQRALLGRQAGPESGVLAAVGGLALFFLFLVLANSLGWVEIKVAPLGLIFGGLIVLNVALAPSAARWATWPPAAVLYESFHAAVLTAALHYLGGPGLGIFIVVYGFLVVHTEILRPGASVFATASVCAAMYAGLAGIHAVGWVSPESVFDMRFTAGQHMGFVVFTWLSLNFLALYVRHHSAQLFAMNARLQDMVADRTSELIRVNQDLRVQKRALERQQDEQQTFVYAVTHDLKGPVNALLVMAKTLRAGPQDGMTDEVRGTLAQMACVAGRTEDMLRDLLGACRVTSATEAEGVVDLTGLVHRSVEALQAKIDRNRIRVEVGQLPPVRGQANKLAHVFTNLVGNAVEYVRSGEGEIAIRGERGGGGRVRVSVRDNGIGVPRAYQRSIFDLFTQVPAAKLGKERTERGTGVGLAVVRRIVEEHGGKVWLESEPGRGSEFFVELPGLDRTNEGKNGGLHALVVEDDPTFADAVRTCLAGPEMGCSVEVVGTGEEARNYLERRPPFLEADSPGFVVLDYRLPDTDGATMVRWIRDQAPLRQTPILVLSQAISSRAADAVLEAGADDVKMKPSGRNELLELLARFVVERVPEGNGAYANT